MIATFILHEDLSCSEKRIKEIEDYEKSGIITSSGKSQCFLQKKEAK